MHEQRRCQLDGKYPRAEVALAFGLHFRQLVFPRARTPLATYRLQFNSRFTFHDATTIVGYLKALGVTDCYASPYLAAVPGSPHGYDVADATHLNREIGTDEDYWAWIEALRARDMGHVLDVVPNHMGIAKSANPWWQDVLENGPSSRFARVFDIEWRPVKAELADKVLIPILGDQYGEVLERQELALAYRDGAFAVGYYDETLPIAPDTYDEIFRAALDPWLFDQQTDGARADADELQSVLTAARNLPARGTRDVGGITIRAREKEVVKRRLAALAERSAAVTSLIDACVTRLNGTLGDRRSFDALDRLLNEQSYRVAHWRVASEEINYRRFFDVNQLAAVRMEDPDVFEEVHRFVFELVRRKGPTGLRIDHVDGLYAPGDYLRRLQARCSEATGESGTLPFFIVVEKILGAGEQLPRDWPVHGTTGYEFGAIVNNLFVDHRNEAAFDEIYARFIRERRERNSFADMAYRSRKQVMHETMSGDINSLGHQLNRFSERNRHFRDFTLYSLISTLKEVIACFPVYRTYVTADQPVTDHDRRYITDAIQSAKRRAPGVTSMVFDFIGRLLLKQTAPRSDEEADERERFIGKFQQITSPVSAKGIEDTAFYVYNRLASLNEVGGDPRIFGLEPGAVHDWMAARRCTSPAALSATSTHDTKRGEDVRARINVLSELPGAWKAAVAKWRTLNRRFKTEVDGRLAPGANEEYLLYQTLVGAWPFDEAEETSGRFAERIRAYLVKALREAKVHTSWLSPEEHYEAAATSFVTAILDRRRPNPFLQSFLPFQARIANLGIYNSLAQLLIKLTAPGVPDFFQGTELWDLALVDPDNRRPVDYDARSRMLSAIAGSTSAAGELDPSVVSELFEHRRDGRLKLFVTARALETRARMRDLFERGDYLPLKTHGPQRDCLFAFARRHEGRVAVTCVPRLIATLTPDAEVPPIGRGVWSDTRIELPPDLTDGPLRDAFGATLIQPQASGGVVTVAAGDVFGGLPIALLISPGADASSGHQPTTNRRG
jgi:(1->4)-alpha-D-glucan 1-alpha-D-glucosylmutase